MYMYYTHPDGEIKSLLMKKGLCWCYYKMYIKGKIFHFILYVYLILTVKWMGKERKKTPAGHMVEFARIMGPCLIHCAVQPVYMYVHSPFRTRPLFRYKAVRPPPLGNRTIYSIPTKENPIRLFSSPSRNNNCYPPAIQHYDAVWSIQHSCCILHNSCCLWIGTACLVL